MPASPATDRPPGLGPKIRPSPGKTRGLGFSLVELMVAMAVLAVLMILLATLFNQVNSAWLKGEGGTETRRGERVVTDYLAAELRGAQIPVAGGGPVTTGNLQFVVNPSTLPAELCNADAIFWQAPIATEASFGDIAMVGYFVKWEAVGGSQRPMLCRFFVNPSRGSGSTLSRNPDFLLYDANPNAGLGSALIDKVVRPADQASGYKGLFAENVLGLWIECLDRKGQPIPPQSGTKFDSRKGYDADIYTDGITWTEKRYLPASVRVSLAQVDSHHAHRLDTASVREAVKTLAKSSKDADEFQTGLRTAAQNGGAVQALLPGVRVYSTTVFLRNAL